MLFPECFREIDDPGVRLAASAASGWRVISRKWISRNENSRNRSIISRNSRNGLSGFSGFRHLPDHPAHRRSEFHDQRNDERVN